MRFTGLLANVLYTDEGTDARCTMVSGRDPTTTMNFPLCVVMVALAIAAYTVYQLAKKKGMVPASRWDEYGFPAL